jgi:hypothetical protein
MLRTARTASGISWSGPPPPMGAATSAATASTSAPSVRHTVVRPVRVATVQPPGTARTVNAGHAASTALATTARRRGPATSLPSGSGGGPPHAPHIRYGGGA